ncbi:23S rRNA (cytosine(2499)-C(5))-methyltransferase [Gangjinia marincola]|uniref:23S rRNA (Cytosine(2499)-C(5))-methyltransferase n=1 Tax=Gangjinia marincola TaxID=578463 RepID=A0ABN1MDG9_9FLAO
MQQQIAVRLTSKAERSVKNGYPWVFEDGIQKIASHAVAGDLAIIFSQKKDKLIAIGLMDPDSPIRIKLIHVGTAVKIDSAFLTSRIEQAYALRLPLLKTPTNAYRLIFGEHDYFPGLIVDIYDKVMVVKLYAEIWKPYLAQLFNILASLFSPQAIVLRFSRNLHKKGAYTSYVEGQVVYGTLKHPIVLFEEHGVRFSAHVIKGHKTGYFLDHRHNRKTVGEMAKDKSVLDVFSYAGGFSVHALAGGAKKVTSVDISAQALTLAKENAELNSYNGKHLILAGDAFSILEDLIAQKRTYDIVIIDPPTFANKQSHIRKALSSYIKLVELGVNLVSKKGIFIMASCSARVEAKLFFDTVESTLAQTGRTFRHIKKTYHDVDHPVVFKDGAYLKTGYYRLE